jgi:hypothetical protein
MADNTEVQAQGLILTLLIFLCSTLAPAGAPKNGQFGSLLGQGQNYEHQPEVFN